MSPANQQFPFSFDWANLEKVISERMTTMNPAQNRTSGVPMDFSWIDKFVKDTMQQSLHSFMGNSNTNQTGYTDTASVRSSFGSAAGPSPEIFETHRSVIARFKLPENTDIHQFDVKVTPNQLKLKHMEDSEFQAFALPTLVSGTGSRAVCRDHIVEVRMPKDRTHQKERDIPIKFG